MKKLLILLPVLALGIFTFSAVTVLNTKGSFAAASEEALGEAAEEEPKEPLRSLDDLTAEQKVELEIILGKRIEDLTEEERAKLESMTDEEVAELAEMASEDVQNRILDREDEIAASVAESELSDKDKEQLEEYREQAEAAGEAATGGTVSPDLFKEHDIEELAFSKGKRGCAMKSSFFFAVSRQYEKGASLEELSSFKIMAPLFEKIITDIEEKGIEQARIDSLSDYNSCVAKYAGEDGPRVEKLDPCAKLNTVVLDTLRSIDKRQAVSTVISRHEKSEIDLSETSYKNLENPVPLFIGKLYEAAARGGKKNATATASTITVGCIN